MSDSSLSFCFIVEEQYRHSRMPRAVVDRLSEWGHRTVVLEPSAAATSLSDILNGEGFDAIVLRTVSGGPGVSLLQALGAGGITTINDAAAVRRVRDKAVVAATAHAQGIPFPDTYFVARPSLLDQVPFLQFPLVVKPASGGFGHDVRLVRTPAEAASLASNGTRHHLIAQPWIPNLGYDMKLYNTGGQVFAVRRRSSLLGGRDEERELVGLTDELRELALRVGTVFGLDIYGVDVVEGPNGWVVIDVNDFPSFKKVPDAAQMVAASVVDIAQRTRA
jgi:glutathione synthase/RimK-type ligase-like ATP-grasp enzyme